MNNNNNNNIKRVFGNHNDAKRFMYLHKIRGKKIPIQHYVYPPFIPIHYLSYHYSDVDEQGRSMNDLSRHTSFNRVLNNELITKFLNLNLNLHLL